MKTEIERICEIMETLLAHQPIIDVPYEKINDIAIALVKEGYGNIKQTQIDTINAIVKYCENPNHWNELKDCKLWGGKSDDLRDFLNGIFKEVKDDNT